MSEIDRQRGEIEVFDRLRCRVFPLQSNVLDVGWLTYRRFGSEHLCNLHRNPIGGDDQGRIQVHISLRDAVRGMAKQARYRKFGEAKIARDTGKGMAEHMRGHGFKFRLPTNTVEYPDDADEVPVAPVGWKDEKRTRTAGLGFDTIHRSFSKRSDLFAALGVGKANAVVASTKPRPP